MKKSFDEIYKQYQLLRKRNNQGIWISEEREKRELRVARVKVQNGTEKRPQVKNKWFNLMVQRQAAIRVTSAYRTTSTDALLVLAELPPIDLLIEEAIAISKADTPERNAARRQSRETLLLKWQERWRSSNKGRWTARLITDIATWLDRKHGDTDHYMTQLLTGHGCLRDYTYGLANQLTANAYIAEILIPLSTPFSIVDNGMRKGKHPSTTRGQGKNSDPYIYLTIGMYLPVAYEKLPIELCSLVTKKEKVNRLLAVKCM
ncbi:unnamed protein product [Ceutorhynchus assimilis]|uniref:Reverse transcriptase n=1 Tax=Ceutorhynchus assimilis TaxID=467358 RepID=A0A9N9MMI7_9CUCU|nr:unnamed protein product [Ceutorhynchus assimilis]